MDNFDDIRPYTDSEIPAAMHRIAANENLLPIAAWIYPGRPLSDVQQQLRAYRTTAEFQDGFMMDFNRQVLQKTVDCYTCTGIERLSPTRPYLFVSNHRDIVLDASLLQYSLRLAGFDTAEITFGSNLMSAPFIIDLGRANKMFTVMRGESPRDFHRSSLRLSAYIRNAITQRGASIWIAQRAGRTKDGNDATDRGIIKMFAMSHATALENNPTRKSVVALADALAELNIVPVAVSYEWEPCDLLKTTELCKSYGEVKYIKSPGEDVTSVITGITAPKGNVHIAVCEPVRPEELHQLATDTATNAFYRQVAALIDRRISMGYLLHPTNYAAHDLRSGIHIHAAHYTPNLMMKFMQRYLLALHNPGLAAHIFNGIYANSVDNVSAALQ